jgi:branched-chain amino acid transport system substrate-binding protein
MKTWTMKTLCSLLCVCAAALFSPLQPEASSEPVIKLGVIGPMKFVYGDHQWKAAQLAADEINSAGGVSVNGEAHRFELLKADDNSFQSIPDAVSAMQRVITVKEADFVVGGFRSEAVLAQQEVMADNQTIFLGTGSAHDEQSERVGENYERYKYWFRVGPHRSSVEARYYVSVAWPAARAIRKELGVDKPRVAILADKAQWADPVVANAKQVFTDMGCEVVGEWRPSFTASSVTAELSAIKSAGAHLIFQLFAGPAGSAVSKQWSELRIPAAIAGVNIEGGKLSQWENTNGKCNYLGTADGVNPGVAVTEKTLPFLEAFDQRFDAFPVYTGVGTYDAVYILKEAIEQAGTLETDAVIKALEKTDYIGTTGRFVFTGTDHKAPHDVKFGPDYTSVLAVQWQNGDRVAYWPDGRELPQALLDIGMPSGWDEVEYEGVKDYILPPWMVEYWKD